VVIFIPGSDYIFNS